MDTKKIKRQISFVKYSTWHDTTVEDFKFWKKAGYKAIFEAIDQLTELGYEMKGEKSLGGKIDKTVFRKLPVPWLNKK